MMQQVDVEVASSHSCSVLSLHRVAPGAVLEGIDVVVPVVSDGTHVAELALDCLGFDKRRSTDDARLPGRVTLRASKGSFIESLELAILTSAGRKSFLRAIHVGFKDPIADFVTLIGGEQVLLWE